ncbi:MAG TPA: hypothetical protein VF679_11690, partial [Pedobacter sp.]
MRKILLTLCLLLASTLYTIAQTNLKAGRWTASLSREDAQNIPIELLVEYNGGKQAIYIVNGSEKLKTDAPVVQGDSLIIRMPVFESYFKAKLSNNTQLKGNWIKGGSAKDLVVPFEAHAGGSALSVAKKTASKNITGKWDIQLFKNDQTKRPAIGN